MGAVRLEFTGPITQPGCKTIHHFNITPGGCIELCLPITGIYIGIISYGLGKGVVKT